MCIIWMNLVFCRITDLSQNGLERKEKAEVLLLTDMEKGKKCYHCSMLQCIMNVCHVEVYFRSVLKDFTIIYSIYTTQPIPVAVRSKAWIYGRLLTGIVGSNPA
jgi:hypothetical protein